MPIPTVPARAANARGNLATPCAAEASTAPRISSHARVGIEKKAQGWLRGNSQFAKVSEEAKTIRDKIFLDKRTESAAVKMDIADLLKDIIQKKIIIKMTSIKVKVIF